MAKGKKPEEKPAESTHLTIDVASFMRTRDSVVSGLATLQDAIQTLSSAYIKHTNAVLGDHQTGQEIDSTLAKLGDNPQLLGDLAGRPLSPAKSVIAEAAPEKKERKKRQHDPNAPKRPLTPFFLYMQTARPIIQDDLGSEAPKGHVSTEGTRRWGVMAEDDKQLWTNAYKDNLRLYNARMHSYRRGNPDAKDMSEIEAAAYADEHNIGADAGANAQLIADASNTALHDEDADGEPEKEPTPPPKTPKAKGSRKGKATPASTAAEQAIVPPSSTSAAPKAAVAEKEKSPDKKRKRNTKKSEEAAEEETETPKSAPKPRKKKTKSDA